MNEVDCMACIANLAAGCPTNGKTCIVQGVTHAVVKSMTDGFTVHRDLPAHIFYWSEIAARWMSFEGIMSWLATREQ